MKIIRESIKLSELTEMASHLYGDMVKAVVDVDRKIIAVDAELHYELESMLLQDGSLQESLWGYNIYPEMYGDDDFIEYDSLINIRPRQDNSSRDVENPVIRKAVADITNKLVTE